MKTPLLTLVALFTTLGVVMAQDAPPPRLEKVGPKVSVIVAGFNGIITVFTSEKGPVVVDTADSASAPAVQALIKTVDPRPIVDVIVTHYHHDHTGGLATLGAGATLHASEATLATYRRKDQAAEAALAKVVRIDALTKGGLLTLGGDRVRLVNPGAGHTNGDTVVVFENEKVISTGDLFFNGLPPYIDVEDGADTAVWAATIESLCAQYPGYKIIPGHGLLSDTAGWLEFAKYLRALRQGVADAIKAGQTREQAQASVKIEQFTSMNDVGNFLTKKANVGWVYDELSRKK
jgi:cyclase